jgi:stage II sporulation protein P
MDLQQKTRRFGAWVILCSMLLRLQAMLTVDDLASFLARPKVASILLSLETGRNVRFSLPFTKEHTAESGAPWSPPESLPVFSPQQAEKVQIHYGCDLRPDLQQLLPEPLQWYLPLPEPTVLILHSHATESYTKSGEHYDESAAYRTLDENHNMLSIGDRVAELLEQYGITVIHDRTLHDHPNYNTAYGNSRVSVQNYLQQYPSIQLVLDLHRDALEQEGKQLPTTARVKGKSCAQLMLVTGTNAGGLDHGQWEKNLSLALKLHTQLEQQTPGITRPLQLRNQRFNQDLLPGSLLVEVGAAGNTHQEALLAAEQLAYAIVALSKGTQ